MENKFILLLILLLILVFSSILNKNTEHFIISLKHDPYSHNYEVLPSGYKNNNISKIKKNNNNYSKLSRFWWEKDKLAAKRMNKVLDKFERSDNINNQINHKMLKTYNQRNDVDNLGSMCIPCDTKCKPECCDSMKRKNYPIYSCSKGCVCLNERQYNYILERGGNNLSEIRNSINNNNKPILSKIETQFALS